MKWLLALVSVFGFMHGVLVFQKKTRRETYAQLDTLYLRVYENPIKYPALIDPEKTKMYLSLQNDEKLRYIAYAYSVFLVVETVYDWGLMDENIRKTWESVFKTEAALHIQWLKDQAKLEFSPFKREFIDFMLNLENEIDL